MTFDELLQSKDREIARLRDRHALLESLLVRGFDKRLYQRTRSFPALAERSQGSNETIIIMSQPTGQSRDRGIPSWSVYANFVFRFWTSPKRCLGFQYRSLLATEYAVDEERLTLEFPAGTVIIIGPETAVLHDSFCQERGRATMVKADGIGIVSVTFIRQGEPIE